MESTRHTDVSATKPSRLNGENIAGAGFLFFSFLFMVGGKVNAVFAVLYPLDYLLAAFGVGLVVLGYRTYRNEMRKMSPDYKPTSHY